MEPLGISRNQLARDLDVPVGRISDITNGKRGITADTALRFGRYFGTGPELWLRLQAEYDIGVARIASWKQIEERVRILDVAETFKNPEERSASPAEVDASGKGTPDSAGAAPHHPESSVDDGIQDVPPEALSEPEPETMSEPDEDIEIPPRPSVSTTTASG